MTKKIPKTIYNMLSIRNFVHFFAISEMTNIGKNLDFQPFFWEKRGKKFNNIVFLMVN